MNKEEIKKAIKVLKSKQRLVTLSNYINSSCKEEDFEALGLGIQSLEAELERTENKPLTLEQLKEMVGEPVWCEVEARDYKGWVLIKSIDDREFVDVGVNSPYCSGRALFEVDTFAKYYKHKPQEVEG